MSRSFDDLPATFTFSQALAAGVGERRLSRLREQGLIDQLGRGLYRRHDAPPADLDLLEVAIRASAATLCLTSALARHGLTDAIPMSYDIALPRGHRIPAVAAPVTWHSFDRRTLDLGRTEVEVEPGVAIGLYSPERSIVDAARLRHLEGSGLAYEALKRWLRWPNASPTTLLATARHFPTAERVLRDALEILL